VYAPARLRERLPQRLGRAIVSHEAGYD